MGKRVTKIFKSAPDPLGIIPGSSKKGSRFFQTTWNRVQDWSHSKRKNGGGSSGGGSGGGILSDAATVDAEGGLGGGSSGALTDARGRRSTLIGSGEDTFTIGG